MAEFDVTPYLGGYTPNPEATAAFEDAIRARRPVELAAAAPAMMDYGQEGDVMPYLATYECEIRNPDGTVWKALGEECPYESQTGNNCTAKAMANLTDNLQCIDAAEGLAVVHRTSAEAVYAFGLATAGMRGDGGCYGSALAKAVNTIGTIDYATVGAPYKESSSRLQQYARNPASIVEKYRAAAQRFRCDEIVKITTFEEAAAWLANRGLITLASNVGFASGIGSGAAPRDARGIVAARGRWPHQMYLSGIIRSDGIETGVISQSWGPKTPGGPQPFRLPSYMFRATAADIRRILAADDSWGIRKLNNFEPLSPQPLPDRWTSRGWTTFS